LANLKATRLACSLGVVGILLVLPIPVLATETEEFDFQTSHLSFTLWVNHSFDQEEDSLLRDVAVLLPYLAGLDRAAGERNIQAEIFMAHHMAVATLGSHGKVQVELHYDGRKPRQILKIFADKLKLKVKKVHTIECVTLELSACASYEEARNQLRLWQDKIETLDGRPDTLIYRSSLGYSLLLPQWIRKTSEPRYYPRIGFFESEAQARRFARQIGLPEEGFRVHPLVLPLDQLRLYLPYEGFRVVTDRR
jgi:hypothetical protein